jgi:pimeloyl-ACP methyl ester carboxylesterase
MQDRKDKNVPVGRVLLTLGAAAVTSALTAALAWANYSRRAIPHHMPLPHAVTGERREINGRAGRLSYYVAGAGAPLLLIHTVNAAASAYEIRPLFEHYRQYRRVYAPDMPGFGFSDRSAREYTPRLYADAIVDMLDQIASDLGPQPVDALAVSLGCEFLTRVASEHPERFRSLALVSPTGFDRRRRRSGESGDVMGNPGLRDFLNFPLWSRPLFDLLNSRPSASYFLKKTFGSYEAIDQGLLEYDYLTSHQPDAQNAPYAFVSGTLFSADIKRLYAALELPVWLAYGTRGEFNDFSGVGLIQGRPNWTVTVFDTGALLYFDQTDTFTTLYDRFLELQK